MTPSRFPDLSAVDAALAAREFLIFKHSNRCEVSATAFAQYEAFAAARPDVPTAWIDVVAERPWSLRVADASGIEHESPQAILVRDGRVAWHASHSAITRKSLEAAVGPRRG
jgi:bacillithiol system protein YtxJ